MTTPTPGGFEVGRNLETLWNSSDRFSPLLNDGFIFDMDAALKEKVSNLYVVDEKAQTRKRRVPAYFRHPPTEVQDQTFPYITIDLLRWERAAYREQRSGDLAIPYVPRGYDYDALAGEELHTDEAPIPYDFFWQITTFARFIEHDRAIQFALAQPDRIPTRFGWLKVGDTIRNLDLMNGPENGDGYDANRKRVFRKTYMVRASAEFFLADIEVLARLSTLHLAVSSKD